MIEIFIDPVSNRVYGYNTIARSTSEEGRVFCDDSHLPMIQKSLSSQDGLGLYYENGKFFEKEMKNDLDVKIEELDARINERNMDIGDEQKTFMDNIINGMSIEEARDYAKEKRDIIKELEMRRDAIKKEYEKKIHEKYYKQLEEEESKISYKHFLSMVSIVRDENDYIEEWIRFHIEECGFDHFYIYDNESKVSVKDYLESIKFKYLDQLTIIPWKTSHASQQDSHNHFLETYGKETRWFLPTDPDEFVYLKNSDGKSLRQFLEEHKNCSSIKCPWVHFNANGHIHKTREPDMVRFTKATTWDDHKHGGKKFSQSNRILAFRSYVPIERFPELPYLEWDSPEVSNFFQLNHYFTRSYEEWCEKIKRGSSNPDYRRKFFMFFELNPDLIHLYDGHDYEQGYGPQNITN